MAPTDDDVNVRSQLDVGTVPPLTYADNLQADRGELGEDQWRTTPRATTELLLGCLLLGVATLAGFVFAHQPSPNPVDSVGFRLLPPEVSSRWAIALVRLGSMPVLVTGIAAICVMAIRSRDRSRMQSCAFAPFGAVLAAEVAKPLIGRHFEGVLSYPSGTVTAIAALAAAGLLVAPQRAKPAVMMLGALVVTAACIAVVVLRWHYPTDALGGVCVGVGTVVTFDGALHCLPGPVLVHGRR